MKKKKSVRRVLDIEPIYDDGETSCFDNLINSILIWLGRNYEVAYLDCFQFVFDVNQVNTKDIWQRGKVAGFLYFDDKLKYMQYVKQFCGVIIQWLDEMNLQSWVDALDEGHPIIAFGDTYYMWWHKKLYKQVHSSHSILIVGYDRDSFYINDTPSNFQKPVKCENVSREQMVKIVQNKSGIIYWRHVIIDEQTFIHILKDELDEKIPDKILSFAKYIMENEIAVEEFEEFDGGAGIFYRAIRNIIRCRHHYLWTLRSSLLCDIKNNLEFAMEKIEYSIEKWNLVKILFQKNYCEGMSGKYKEKIYTILEEISILEGEAIASIKAIDI